MEDRQRKPCGRKSVGASKRTGKSGMADGHEVGGPCRFLVKVDEAPVLKNRGREKTAFFTS